MFEIITVKYVPCSSQPEVTACRFPMWSNAEIPQQKSQIVYTLHQGWIISLDLKLLKSFARKSVNNSRVCDTVFSKSKNMHFCNTSTSFPHYVIGKHQLEVKQLMNERHADALYTVEMFTHAFTVFRVKQLSVCFGLTHCQSHIGN